MRSKSIEMYKLGWMNPILVDFFLCEYEEISFHVTSEYPEMMHSQCIDILDSKVHSNISSVVEFQRGWVLKSNLFAQESTC